MHKKFCVWDTDSKPELKMYFSYIFWNQSFDIENFNFSIPKFVEDRADQLKFQYLELIYDLGNVLCDDKTVIEHLKIRKNFSCWWMTLLVEKSNWAKTPEITNIIKLMALEIFLEENQCTELFIKSDNQELIHAIKMLCITKEIDLCILPNKERVSLKNFMSSLRPSMPKVLKGLIWLFREVMYSMPFILMGYKNWIMSKHKYIFVTYFSPSELKKFNLNYFNSSFWGPLPKHLTDNKVPVNWLYLPTRKVSFLKTLKTLKKLNNTKNDLHNHTAIVSFLDWKVIYKSLQDWLLVSKKHSKIKNMLQPRCGIYWPLIKKDISRSLLDTELLNELLFLSLFEKISSLSLGQNKIIYLSENQPWEYALIQSFKARDSELIAFAHSTIRYWDLRYFNDPRSYLNTSLNSLPKPNFLAVNGTNDRSLMCKFGYPLGSIKNVESLRYLYLKNVSKTEINNKNKIKTLLVLGDFLEKDTVHMLCFLKHPEVQETLKNFNILIKPHPACFLSNKDIKGINAKLVNSDLVKLIPISDIIFTGNVTSAAVEAYQLNKKVISVLNNKILNMSPLRGIEGVTFVSDERSLNSALLKIEKTHLQHNKFNYLNLDNNIKNWRQLLDFNSQDINKSN